MSATQVPLRPIRKGSLLKFWIAMVALVIAGAGLAYAATQSLVTEVTVETIEEGSGEPLTLADGAMVIYRGTLENGTEFDSTQGQAVPLLVSGVVPGFRDAMLQMREGGKYEIVIPGEQAYGANPPPGSGFRPNEDLYFEIEIAEVVRGVANQLGQVPPPLPVDAIPEPDNTPVTDAPGQ